MELKLQRVEKLRSCTMGKLYLDDYLYYDTLELPWLGNTRKISCIPPGRYELKLRYSPKFRTNLYEVANVPGRSDILIHAGNKVNDDGKIYEANSYDDLQGCIAVGERVGCKLANSRATLSKLMTILGGKNHIIVIE